MVCSEAAAPDGAAWQTSLHLPQVGEAPVTTNAWLIALNACLNVVQALGIAYLAARYRGPK